MKEMFRQQCLAWCKQNESVCVLTPDYGYGFTNGMPAERVFKFGPMEQSVIGIAAGMAIAGKLPIVYGITPFIVERAFEQLKLDIDQQQLKTIIVCYSDYPADGPTHVELNCRHMMKLLTWFEYHEPVSAEDCSVALAASYASSRASLIKLRRLP